MSYNFNIQEDLLTIFRNNGRPLLEPEPLFASGPLFASADNAGMGEFAESAGNGKMGVWDDFISGAGDREALEKND